MYIQAGPAKGNADKINKNLPTNSQSIQQDHESMNNKAAKSQHSTVRT